GLPIWMMVGEADAGWVDATQSTAAALEAAGAQVTVDILNEQGHVLIVNQDELMAWIEGL
ncbi:MAG: hypothetical protein GWN89_11320, partial [Thermoplasmata archaeon]|nr:hypothetical protein [Thermoplasmata archaeon]NIT77873.1 hypothetical protein [Thermoplasmata archaeon]NIU49586.1 hypothetical protein [Thermoplasmata archaeon]NIY04243.1 hypothetical protein [Thermoplasmata archaeon]